MKISRAPSRDGVLLIPAHSGARFVVKGDEDDERHRRQGHNYLGEKVIFVAHPHGYLLPSCGRWTRACFEGCALLWPRVPRGRYVP